MSLYEIVGSSILLFPMLLCVAGLAIFCVKDQTKGLLSAPGHGQTSEDD